MGSCLVVLIIGEIAGKKRECVGESCVGNLLFECVDEVDEFVGSDSFDGFDFC